jgi:hypothetical protein
MATCFARITLPDIDGDEPVRRKRVPDTGMIRPYRPCPSDFVEAYLRLGFSRELREELRCNDRQIVRWIGESGGEDLRQRRAQIVGGGGLRPNNRSKRYVLGLTLTPVGAK